MLLSTVLQSDAFSVATQLSGMLDVLAATNSLVAAADKLTTNHLDLTWPISGDWCDAAISFSADQGLGIDDVHIDYDDGLYSYAGCRCAAGYDNIYTFDETGNALLWE